MRHPADEGSGHRRIDQVVFVGTVVLSTVLIALPGPRRTALADVLRRSALRPFVAAHRWAARRTDLRERIERLRRANTRLERRILRREGVAEENRQLRDLLSLGLRREGEFAPADLAAGTPGPGRGGRFLLDVGWADGIEPPAGVVVARGVVGVVRTAEADRSYGHLWTHPDFRVSVRTDGGGATGIVHPLDLGEDGTAMLFEGAPYQRRVPEGTLLVTTGLGGIYPPGVPVGTVRAVSSVESGWARSYRVEPAVRPGTVHAVLVWRRSTASGPPPDTLPPSGPDSTLAPALESVAPDAGASAPAPSDSPAPNVPASGDTSESGP